jgi:hypothetical protein
MVDFISIHFMLNRVDVGNVTDVSQVHSVCVLKVEVCTLRFFCAWITLRFEKYKGKGA